MSFTDDLSYKFENWALYFQGGVRRSVLIFAAVCLILLTPLYFLGQTAAAVWFTLDFNPNKFDSRSIFNPKNVAYKKYTIDRSQLVPLANGETVLYTTINNKENTTVGYFPFIYRVQILDSKGSILSDELKEDYLLPGDVKYVVASPGNDKGSELRVSTEPNTQALQYNPQADNIAKRINFEVRNAEVIDEENTQNLKLKAYIKNKDIVAINNVDLLYIVRDDLDRVVGIGRFQWQNIQPEEERAFDVNYPRPKFRRATRLDIRTFVNYMNKNNVQIK